MKRAAAVLGVAIAGSQAGHLLAYALRFGAAAQQVQSAGVHMYFPLLLKTVLGAIALALIASLFLLGVARLATGRKVEPGSAPSLLRLLAALYTLQLAFFFVQETVEGSAAGQIFLWGLVGQLPVALLGAVALRWFLGRITSAIQQLWTRCESALRLVPYALALVVWPVAADLMQGFEPGQAIDLRGPPLSF
jgi:hypothetical protein